jgi:MoaA/NifB/PqqE/SkfB family radical SAM enzyme
MKVDFAKLRSRVALLRGLIDGEAAYTGPVWIALDMTRRCNNVCLGCFFHCVQPREPSPGDHSITDLPLELAESLALDLARLHTPEVILAGEGESLLHPRFFEIVTCFKKAGLTVRAFTNGSLIDEAMAQKLAASGLDFLQVTFWAVNQAEHLV